MIKIATAFIEIMTAVAACVTDGCKSTEWGRIGVDDGCKVRAVCVGMEKSSRFGSCPGAEYDARRITQLLSHYTENVKTLCSQDATVSAVKRAIEDGVECSELFVLYYSGHGGSGKFADTGSEEVDGKDEYLCLDNGYFRDNEIWNIISKAKCRVMLIFDCCHSETMFKIPNICVFSSSRARNSDTTQVMCWSGCPDDSVSYGSHLGGQLTNAILRHFDTELTYDEIWKKIEKDSLLKKFEKVCRTDIGSGFGSKKVFN